MKLFLDANVLFTAAHNPRGKAAFTIELAGEGLWEVVTSPFAEEEARRNLEAEFSEAIEALDDLMRNVGVAPSLFDEPCAIFGAYEK